MVRDERFRLFGKPDRCEVVVRRDETPDLVHGTDVGMVQRGRRLRLQHEPLAGVFVAGQFRGRV